MDMILGLLAITGLGLACAIFLAGWPTVCMSLALWLYRHGRKQERWQKQTQARLDEAWMKELER